MQEKTNRQSDIELVKIAQQGDDKALEALLGRYKNLVRAKARSYFLVGADTEDIIQEGMIGLYKAIRDYSADTNVENQRKASFSSFADMCVTRQIITAIKAATRQKHIPLNSYISLSQPVFENDSEQTYEETLPGSIKFDPENIYIGRESYLDLMEKINKSLSKLEMSVFREYMSGKSYIEIAETLEKPVKSVDNALQRIKGKLVSELDIRQD